MSQDEKPTTTQRLDAIQQKLLESLEEQVARGEPVKASLIKEFRLLKKSVEEADAKSKPDEQKPEANPNIPDEHDQGGAPARYA